jgi:hypothetical protein
MNKERKLLFTVDSFDVYSDSIYKIGDKIDGDAPTGFVKARVSKLPSAGVGETFPFRYIIPEGMKTGKWDTGFYKESPMYSFTEDPTKKVKDLVQNVLKPYREARGFKAIDETDNEIMDAASFTIKSKMTLNTNNPVDVMTLYAALVTKNVVPPNAKGDSRYAKAFYTVEDSTKLIDEKHQGNALHYDCMKKFAKLHEVNKPALDLVFGWMELKAPEGASEETLYSILHEYTKDSYDKSKTFISLVEEANTNNGLAKLEIYAKLKDLFRRGVKLTKQNGSFHYDGEEVGPDLKYAAENISKNSSLKEVKLDILK